MPDDKEVDRWDAGSPEDAVLFTLEETENSDYPLDEIHIIKVCEVVDVQCDTGAVILYKKELNRIKHNLSAGREASNDG